MNIKKNAVQVTITSDLMCPWCWVGLRKLQEATKVAQIDTEIIWHPFQLRPNIPVEGTPKGGSPQSRVGAHLRAAGADVGIDFTGLTDRTPNTTLFHATIKHLQDDLKFPSNVVTQFHEAVFEGYFTLGVYPDKDGLLKMARTMKTTTTVADAIAELYSDDKAMQLHDLQEDVQMEALNASRQGVSGVPTFAFNGKTAFSGAQAVPTFVHQLKQAAASS